MAAAKTPYEKDLTNAALFAKSSEEFNAMKNAAAIKHDISATSEDNSRKKRKTVDAAKDKTAITADVSEDNKTTFEKAGYGTMDELLIKCEENTGPIRDAQGNEGLGVYITGFGGDVNFEVSTREDDTGVVTEIILRNEMCGKPIGHRKRVGVIGMDSGGLLIADPCYVLQKPPVKSKEAACAAVKSSASSSSSSSSTVSSTSK